MSDVPYYKPPVEGPLFPDDANGIADEFSGFLAASDRDVGDEVARRNIQDKTEDSFKFWLQQRLDEMGLNPPQAE